MNGEGFAFFRWHFIRYGGVDDNYCGHYSQSHRDYCLIKWEKFRNE